MVAKVEVLGDPESMKAAMRRPDSGEWMGAAGKEFQSFHDNETWDLVELPEDAHLLEGIWLFSTKRDENGVETRKKARWVINGSRQRKELGDYDETASPTLRFTSMRSILARAAQKRWPLLQMDFEAAYLNGDLDEDIYVRQPEGFEVPGKEHLVCKLKKSVYGLKQSGRNWNKKIDAELRKLGFTRSKSDPCVYHKNTKATNGEIILGLYVDDSLLTGEPVEELETVKNMLQAKFKMKDLGSARHLLAIHIKQSPDRRFIELSQHQFVLTVLKRFGYEECKGVTTPMSPDFAARAFRESEGANEFDMKRYPYRQALGSLMYLMVATRPDLAYILSVLSQYSTRFTKFHWDAVTRVFRYLQHSKDLVLRYDGDNLKEVYRYSDSDWGGDRETRRSTTGYTFLLSGAAISWKSRRQGTVAGSTAEAEYMAIGDSTKEALWLRSLLYEIKAINLKLPTTIMVDNQGSIHLAKNDLLSERMKHIDIRHHFIREKILEGQVSLTYCPTGDMVADVLTKALERVKHWRFVYGLGLRGDSIPVGEL
jgi:hypothetical protein